MIKYIRYNKGKILAKITQFKKMSLCLVFVIPTILYILDSNILKEIPIIYIMQVLSISIGILGYLSGTVLLFLLILVYTPIVAEEKEPNNDQYGDS